uniref:Uncharacterized protein n=2 Tax=Pyxicephalus adspersus TaxID=30357 RepID=A0AAV2ZRJ2_PYXAD|nr:TPA: hypothetical protein GDO54_004459 [Pyxicephalus adspersus]
MDIDNVEERIYEQIEFLNYDNKHRMYNLLAYLKHLKGDNDEAILQLQKAETLIQVNNSLDGLNVERIVMYGNYAWVFYHESQFMKSFAYVKKVDNILKKYESPSMQNTLLLEIYSEKSWIYFTCSGENCEKSYEKAAEYFEKVLELDPENPDLNSGYAIVVYRLENINLSKNQTDRSVSLLRKAVQLNPNDRVLKTLLALKYEDLGIYWQAEKLIKEALKGPECPFVLRYVAKFYRRKHMNHQAITLLEKALDLTPKSASLHYQLGICYKKVTEQSERSEYQTRLNGHPAETYTEQKAKAISKARFFFERAVELKTTFVTAYMVLAKVYVKAGEYQKAEETFHKTLSMKNITSIEKQELHYSWACYERDDKNSQSEAIRHLKEAIMIKKQSFFRKDAMEDLKSLAETLITHKSDDPTGFGLLGFIHQQDSQDNLATEYYRKASQLDPGNQEYLQALSTLQPTFSCPHDN